MPYACSKYVYANFPLTCFYKHNVDIGIVALFHIHTSYGEPNWIYSCRIGHTHKGMSLRKTK